MTVTPLVGGRAARSRVVTLAAIVVLMIAAVAATVIVSPKVRHQLALSFTRQPDDFPELFFDSPASLPTTYVAGEPIEVTAGITNVSDGPHTYQFVVQAHRVGGTSVALQHGSVEIAGHGTRALQIRVVPPKGTNKLTVLLPHSERLSIHFLLHQKGT